MNNKLEHFYKAHNQIFESAVKQVVSDTSNNKALSNMLKSLKKSLTPAIDDKDKKRLTDSYEKWGKTGWTIPPYIKIAEIKVFNSPPADFEDANKKMARYCTESNMLKMFNQLRRYQLNRPDLEDSIELYHARHYKACAMMLFAIIDEKLINMQSDEERKKNKKKYRETGLGAGNNILKRKGIDKSENDIIFLALSYLNRFAAFKTFFEHGNDFQVQPKVVNRNFLDHGMYAKRIYKKDCNQIFLLLYNLFRQIKIPTDK